MAEVEDKTPVFEVFIGYLSYSVTEVSNFVSPLIADFFSVNLKELNQCIRIW